MKEETTKRRLRVYDDAGAFVGLEIDVAGDETTTTVTNNVTGERTEVPCFVVEGWSLWLSRARQVQIGDYAIDAAGVRSEYQDVWRALNRLHAAWHDAINNGGETNP